jgi:hypothetical protein
MAKGNGSNGLGFPSTNLVTQCIAQRRRWSAVGPRLCAQLRRHGNGEGNLVEASVSQTTRNRSQGLGALRLLCLGRHESVATFS